MFLNVTPVTRCDTVTLYRNITIKLNHLPIVVIYMEDINSINYIHITTVNQEKNTPTSEMNRVISSNKERNEIHSSSQACRRGAQNESPTNLTKDIPIFFNYGGVTL